MKHWPAWLLAAVIVLILRLATPTARIMTDGVEYLKVATMGLDPRADLSAPFAYRFAVPMLVHGVSLATGIPARSLFPPLVLAVSVVLLFAVYRLALATGISRGYALVIMVLLASSAFMLRYPLLCPFEVDIEACALSFAAFALLLRRSTVAALATSLAGLFFKEFFLAPLAVIISVSLFDYVRERSVVSLRWATVSLALTVVVFLAPRILIPVTYSFGTIVRYQASEPSHTLYLSELRRFLVWPPRLGTPVNVLLAVFSFWLPALMLLTGQRIRRVWQTLGGRRMLLVIWMLVDCVLMMIGGTKITVFVTYTSPVLVFVLGLLPATGMRKAEMILAVAATIVFNRMIFGFGSPGCDPGDAKAFYGAYWYEVGEVTVLRFAEVAGWVILACTLRWALNRRKRDPSLVDAP